MTKRFFCSMPFNQIEFCSDGNAHSCCPAWVNFYSLGNWHENTFEEIWNGEQARNLRRSILDGSYKYCNRNVCLNFSNQESMFLSDDFIAEKYQEKCSPPKTVIFSHDVHCNSLCIMCRDTFKHNSAAEEKKLDDLIEKIFLPVCANADYIRIGGQGEALSSKHSKKLIKTIAEKYPNVKFVIHSNGFLLTRKNLAELGIQNRILRCVISLHAATEKTYNKIVKGSNFKKVIENLDVIYHEKIAPIALSYVVSSINYKQMVSFIRFANRWGGGGMRNLL